MIVEQYITVEAGSVGESRISLFLYISDFVGHLSHNIHVIEIYEKLRISILIQIVKL